MPLLYDWLTNAVRERGGAGGNSNAAALVYRDTYVSWRGLLHRVDRRAQDLRTLGIGPGTWVGLMLGNVPDFVILTLALSKLEAVTVPLDPTTSSRDLDMILEGAPLRALITRPHGGEGVSSAPVGALRVAGKVSAPRFVPESRRRLQGTLLTCALYRRDPPRLDDGVRPEVVLFTLDAGGDPKGVVRSDQHLTATAEALGGGLHLRAEDRILCITPLYQAFGFDVGLVCSMAHALPLFLDEETVLPRLAKLMTETEVNIFPGTPSVFAGMARLPTARPLKLREPRLLSSGSPLPPAIADAFAKRFGVPVLSTYHSTETGPVAVDRDGRDPGTVGRAMPGVEVRIAAANGTTLPVGTTGPVWVRSSATSNVFVPKVPLRSDGVAVPVGRASRDGWFRTGDLGYSDRQGRLTLTGREDDLVKVDGRRIALGEVEGCLEAFAKVRAARVRLIMDEFGGPRVVARVVRSGTCRADELIDHCARLLAPYKVPREIEFCESLDDEPLLPPGGGRTTVNRAGNS